MSFDPVSAALDIGVRAPEPQTMVCRDCEFPRPMSEFRWRNDNRKHRTICKACETSMHRQKYMRQRGRVLEKYRVHRETDLVGRILKGAKDTAQRKGLAFNLMRADISVPETCPYLGTKITNIQGSGYVGTNASIDRIDSNDGYVRGNVQVISRRANSMKNDASADELVYFAKRVLLLAGER